MDDRQSWGYAPVGIFVLILLILLVWSRIDSRPLIIEKNNVSTGVRAAGEDLKSLGRDAAGSIRRAVQ
jgi:hypothetical protein